MDLELVTLQTINELNKDDIVEVCVCLRMSM